MADVVLDSSAILAVFNDEPGAELAEPLLRYSHISTLILAEVATKLIAKGINPQDVHRMIDAMELRRHDFTPVRALATAALCTDRRALRVSLADRACLGLAAELNLPAITADRVWTELGLPVDIRLIR